ncbi:CPBP family intramembrane glutamic endopeptidase [Vallitalea sp.]|uniref:CPBP family intramembrane glutamic endopeptidase n=1 Tax=Vallitalea sp. TaxID=1882829 RepID=UPI0025E11641|nr:type II CAAX endopeptidase family protein [Vallitalea sp.]MCT4688702.1 CPBP family intramembrane metalloprotease [Vallitalea sp.]
MNRLKAFGNSVIYVIISKLIQVLAVVVAGIYFTVKLNVYGTSEEDLYSFFASHSLLITIIAWVVTFGIILLIYLISKNSFINETNLNKRISFKTIAICIVCGIGINIAIDGILTMININELVPEYEELMASISNNNFYITLISVGILAPIFEELLYRGIVLNKLRNGFSIFGAVMIQAIFFGIGHMNLVQGTYAFLIGIILGYVVVWTGSLYSSIILHIVINSFTTIISNMQGKEIGYNYLLTFIGTGVLLTIIGLRIIYVMSEKKENDIIEFID